MKYILYFIVPFICVRGYAQNEIISFPNKKNCDEALIVKYYDDSTSTDKRNYFPRLPNNCADISVICHFEDTISIVINGKKYFDNIPTHTISGNTILQVAHAHKIEYPTLLRLYSKLRNKCYEIMLDNKYKVITLECYTKTPWFINYSNYHEYREFE